MLRQRFSYWVLSFLAVSTSGIHAHEDHPADAESSDGLPRVLILGDSISMDYTPFVKELLKGRADVHRPAGNCGPTTRGLAMLEAWLGDGDWDVIHFNFGLHDLKHIDDQGNHVAFDQGTIQVPLDQYKKNLQQLVRRLQQTGAILIWCSTTPVPEGAHGRRSDDSIKYNSVAKRVMRHRLGQDHVINDLHAFCKPRLSKIQRPANVHFTELGSRALAGQVAAAVLHQLSVRTDNVRLAQGVVFDDQNGNGVFDSGDEPRHNVKVSNGADIVYTNARGRYVLPVTDDSILFVLKPRGYRTPVDEKQLPQFYYVHKPGGSPPSQYRGVSPTGPLPTSIDFPLYRQREPDQFRAIMFGDPQPRNQREVDYMAHDVIEELVGTDASFGVSLGDIAFDALDVFEPQARAIAVLGIPWYNVIGNHDLNFEARHDRHSDESFERVFGPAYYSFDYGPVHFLVLDDVEWLVDDQGNGRYQGGLGKRQMKFIRRDLAEIPAEQLVVLMMHIPLTDVRDRHELFRLIEQRPFCMSISAHTHDHQHRYITAKDGWRGPEPHHHIINVTVGGSWWSGTRDERGIPHATMSDGAPNGYSVLSFDGQRYELDFKAAGRSADYQMAIQMPEVVDASTDGEIEIFANVFNGAENTTVTLAVSGTDVGQMTHTRRKDPAFVALFESENALRDKLIAQGVPEGKLWRAMPKPGISSHLWRHVLDVSQLPVGTYAVSFSATFADGRQVKGHRLFRLRRSGD